MYRIIIILLFVSKHIFAEEFDIAKSQNNHPSQTANTITEQDYGKYKQWFTGPFFVPSPISMSPQNPSVNPYIAGVCNYGNYDNNWHIHTAESAMWSTQYGIYAMFGIVKGLGVDIVWQASTNYRENVQSTYFNDLIVRLGYQFLTDKKMKGDFTPNARIIIQETFPTGKYNKLNSAKLNTDSMGQGSFQTGAYLAAEKEFFSKSKHPLNLYVSQGFFIPSVAHVKRLSCYGGNNFTNGKVYPGFVISSYFSGEVELSKHLNFAWDMSYLQTLKGRFKGIEGTGDPVNISQTVNFFIAPELELVFTEKAALLIGPWATIIGQNTGAYVGLFLEFVYVF